MESPNFHFLSIHDQRLQLLAGQAEVYFANDRSTSLIKIRQYAELMAGIIAAKAKLRDEIDGNQVDLIGALLRHGVINKKVADGFHLIRKQGNKANHDFTGSHASALQCIQFAYGLGVWFHKHWGDPNHQPKPFSPPKTQGQVEADTQAELDNLRAQVAKAQTEAERAEAKAAHEASLRLSAEETAQQAAEEIKTWEALAKGQEETEAQLKARLRRLEAAQEPAPLPKDVEFELTEAGTRALIDSQLRQAGWEADTKRLRYSKGTRPQAGQSIAIAEWPTETGPVDYALSIDDKCVALIEAKKKAADIPGALGQAIRYGHGIKIDPEQIVEGAPYKHSDSSNRVPFLFATNSRPYIKQYAEKSGIWYWDARIETNRSQALAEWFSPADLRAKLEQETTHSVEGLQNETFAYTGLRPYQQKAVTAIESAIGHG